jgi:hypothetical protein
VIILQITLVVPPNKCKVTQNSTNNSDNIPFLQQNLEHKPNNLPSNLEHRGLCRRRKVLEEESKKGRKMENGGVGTGLNLQKNKAFRRRK